MIAFVTASPFPSGINKIMSSRLDSTPEQRLRRIARFLWLDDDDVQTALQKSKGNAAEAEQYMRHLSAAIQLKKKASNGATMSKEERIVKAALALASHPEAVDILVTSLSKVQAEPSKERFRKVNVSAPGPFKDKVASRPGGTELLYSVGFTPMHGHLVLQQHDPALLRHALDALAAAKEGDEYRTVKARQLDAQAAAKARAEEEAAAKAKRAAHFAAVPAEPSAETGGASTSTCVITFSLGEGSEGSAWSRVARRRFESDNTLKDVVSFVRSLPEVPLDAAIRIENVTTRPYKHLDPDNQRQRDASLYALDLWPMGHVGVVIEAVA